MIQQAELDHRIEVKLEDVARPLPYDDLKLRDIQLIQAPQYNRQDTQLIGRVGRVGIAIAFVGIYLAWRALANLTILGKHFAQFTDQSPHPLWKVFSGIAIESKHSILASNWLP